LAGLLVGTPTSASAQLGKTLLKGAFCAGGAVAGLKLGDKIAQMELTKRNLIGAEAQKIRKGIQLGAALVLCKGGAMLAGTIYAKLSKKDLDARQREIDAAVAEAEPVTREYVLPESGLKGEVTTTAVTPEGNKECRTVVDHLADASKNEPAIVKYCRKPPKQEFEPELGI
jgi:hypothetical protein